MPRTTNLLFKSKKNRKAQTTLDSTASIYRQDVEPTLQIAGSTVDYFNEDTEVVSLNLFNFVKDSLAKTMQHLANRFGLDSGNKSKDDLEQRLTINSEYYSNNIK